MIYSVVFLCNCNECAQDVTECPNGGKCFLNSLGYPDHTQPRVLQKHCTDAWRWKYYIDFKDFSDKMSEILKYFLNSYFINIVKEWIKHFATKLKICLSKIDILPEPVLQNTEPCICILPPRYTRCKPPENNYIKNLAHYLKNLNFWFCL